jgi:YD repeat-containing protein
VRTAFGAVENSSLRHRGFDREVRVLMRTLLGYVLSGIVGWVAKPSAPAGWRRWVSCLYPAYALFVCLAVALIPTAQANPLHRFLDFEGYCFDNCASTWNNVSGNGVQKTGKFESYEVAKQAVISSYSLLSGYTKNINGVDPSGGINVCGTASVTEPVTFQYNHPNYGQQWRGDLSFNHTCRAYDANGSFIFEFVTSSNSFGVVGTCKKGYVEFKDAATGECLGPPEANACPDVAGNPVLPANSVKSLVDRDFPNTIGSASFARAYRSRHNFPPAPSFGRNWTHTYATSVVYLTSPAPANVEVAALRADGRAVRHSIVNALWEPKEKNSDRLTELKDINNLRTGWKYYESSTENTELYNATGVLQSITTRAGVVQTLAYNASGQLATVTDSYGRTLSFTYNAANATLGAGNIATVTDHLGNVVSYAYDTNNNLVTVTYPSGAPGSGLTATKTYLYNEQTYTANTNLPNALTGILDENGIRFATYQYDSQGRAISTEHAGGVEKYQLNYVSPYAQTIVTDPLGTARTYNFQTILGVVKTTGVSEPCPSCGGSSSQATTCDANGNVASKTDFNGNRTNYVFDLTRNEFESLRVNSPPLAA